MASDSKAVFVALTPGTKLEDQWSLPQVLIDIDSKDPSQGILPQLTLRFEQNSSGAIPTEVVEYMEIEAETALYSPLDSSTVVGRSSSSKSSNCDGSVSSWCESPAPRHASSSPSSATPEQQ
mmetsp:Transcript_78479/g.163041  ORF Transcript_78479/g.163041 Transcript_78479/m.163041 type:complete len:122 (-) Transcript_78479:101-466(-)